MTSLSVVGRWTSTSRRAADRTRPPRPTRTSTRASSARLPRPGRARSAGSARRCPSVACGAVSSSVWRTGTSWTTRVPGTPPAPPAPTSWAPSGGAWRARQPRAPWRPRRPRSDALVQTAAHPERGSGRTCVCVINKHHTFSAHSC